MLRSSIFCLAGLVAFSAGDDKYKGPKWDKVIESVRAKCNEVFTGQPSDAAHFCDTRFDSRHFTKGRFDHSDDNFARVMAQRHEHRMRETATAARGVHNFTEVGYNISSIKPDLLGELQAFHTNARITTSHPENMPVEDPYLSGRESDTWLANLPHHLSQKVHDFVRAEVSKWSGVPEEDLLKTSVFGIRLYHHGSVLNMHIDRKDTLILSAILEVGRGDKDDTADWPLRIANHAGEEITVPNRVGQLVLYESATCPHGRNIPFPGREMANVFVHFRPRGWPEAYNRKTRFLPEFVNGKRVVFATDDPLVFLIDNSELQTKAVGIAYRQSTDMDHREEGADAHVPWSTRVKGVLVKGWLNVSIDQATSKQEL